MSEEAMTTDPAATTPGQPAERGALADLLDAGTIDGQDTAAAPADDQGFDADEEFGEPSRGRRLSRITAGLVVAVVCALAFTGGVLVQKHHDASTTTATGLPSLGAGGLPNFGAGGFPPGLGGAGSGSTAGGTSTASGPAVIGTVVAVHGNDITVKDIAGKTHVVHTTTSTSLVHQTDTSLPRLTPGASITVDGAAASDGSIAATTVTTR
jgi:hypothetical protein